MSGPRRRKKLAQVLERDGDRCWLCGSPVDPAATGTRGRASLDHVVRLADGGSNALENLKLAHAGCNTRRDVREMRARAAA